MNKDNFFIFKDVTIDSDYLPLITFKTINQKEAVENYIISEAKDFFINILKINDELIQIPYPNLITKQDFNTRDIKDFYNILFYDLDQRHSNSNRKLKIKEYPTACAGSANFRHLLNELKIKQNFIPDIIYIDYLNICMSSRIRNGANVNSYTLVKAIAEELRGLAVEHNVPIFSATQTNRSGYCSRI